MLSPRSLGKLILFDLCMFFSANGWHNHQLEGRGVFFFEFGSCLFIEDYEEGTWKVVRDTCKNHQKPRLFHSSIEIRGFRRWRPDEFQAQCGILGSAG